LAFGFLAACLWIVFGSGQIPPSEWYPRDAWTYLAAGERLNAGHQLYAMSPGDRPVLMTPGVTTAAFLSPPFMAVLWRPIAFVGEPGAFVWWGVCIVALLGSVILLARKAPIATSVVVGILALSIATEISVGNVDSLIVPSLIMVWLLWRDGKWSWAGSLAVVLAAAKALPVFAVLWLIAVGPSRRLARPTIAAGIAVAAMSLVGSGLQAQLDYLHVLPSAATQGSLPLSLSGMAARAGLPFAGLASIAGAVLAGAAVVRLRTQPAASFAAASIGMVVATTAANLSTFVLLIPILAPLAWPPRSNSRERHLFVRPDG